MARALRTALIDRGLRPILTGLAARRRHRSFSTGCYTTRFTTLCIRSYRAGEWLTERTTVTGPTGPARQSRLLRLLVETPIEELRSMMYAYATFHRGVEAALRGLP